MGPAQIVAYGQDDQGQPLQAALAIRVEAGPEGAGSSAESLEMYYSEYRLAKPGRTIPISVDATTPSGKFDVLSSAETTLESTNPKVAVIEPAAYSAKQIRAVDYGKAAVHVRYRNLEKSIPVLVGIWSTRGDLEGDGSVDQTDLDVINLAMNQQSTGPGDPRDLNGDGYIDLRDAEIERSLCSRPNCATHY